MFIGQFLENSVFINLTW